jgi:hypothetical protein
MPAYFEVVPDSTPSPECICFVTRVNKRGRLVTKEIRDRQRQPRSIRSALRLASESKLKRITQTQTETQMELHQTEASRPAQLKVLRTYAKLPDSTITTTLPPTVYFSHTQHTLTIFDAYPKALFHFLVLPRITSSSSDSARSSDLTDLRTLLRRRASTDAKTRTRAEETLRALADEAERMRGVVEEEMRTRYGFVWDIWTGFHAVPSMECVLSSFPARTLMR